MFVFQATINALCAPAWRKNQSSRLPRQKGPVLSAENPDVNWPCQIPAHGGGGESIFSAGPRKLSCRFLEFLFSSSLSPNNSDLSIGVTSFFMSLLAFLGSFPDGVVPYLAHHKLSSRDEHTLSCSFSTGPSHWDLSLVIKDTQGHPPKEIGLHTNFRVFGFPKYTPQTLDTLRIARTFIGKLKDSSMPVTFPVPIGLRPH